MSKKIEGNELAEISPGFFVLGKETRGKHPVEELVLLVHAYSYSNDPNNLHYESERDQLVKNHKQPVLIGVMEDELEDYVSQVRSLTPQGFRIFYLTYGGVGLPKMPEKPISLSMNEFVIKLRELFNPYSIRLGGAEFIPPKNGCLGSTYEMLSSVFRTKIDARYCWYNPNSRAQALDKPGLSIW